MVKINSKQAREFLDKINHSDSIVIFCHTDLDGFASGILFHDFCISKGCKYIDIHPINYGLNKISDFDLKGKTKVLIADLAPGFVVEDLKKLPPEIKVFYTDHHPAENESELPMNIFELRTLEQGYIPSSRTIYELCGGKEWLAVVAVISDFGDKYEVNQEFIDSFLRRSGKSLEYLKQDVMYTISRAIIYFEKHVASDFIEILKNITFMEDVKLLETYEKPVKEEFERCLEDFSKNAEKIGKINFYYFEPEYGIKSFLINSLSSKVSEEVYIFATPKTEALIGLSARNQSKRYNMAKILQDCLKGLEDSLAGGHKESAGGYLHKRDLEKFKQHLKNYDLEQAII